MNTGVLGNLIVTLDGDAKLAQPNVEGLYILTSIPVNGKQNWIHVQGSIAIWYDKEHKHWKIGPKDSLGTCSTCYLHSTENTKTPKEATTWQYWSGNHVKWMATSKICSMDLGFFKDF